MTVCINKHVNKKAITMSPRVNDKQLFKNYNKIWKETESLMSIDFDSKPTYGYDDKYIKTKIKTYANSIITNFYNKKMQKEKVPCKCLPIIMLDSVLYAYDKYNTQTFLEECKYAQEKIKSKNYIDEQLKSESDTGNDE